MLKYLLLISFTLLLAACEDTNVLMMTEAATDAVTAITLSNEDVKNLARGAAHAADSKQRVAPPGNPYDTRLRKLVANHFTKDDSSFDFKVYLTKDVNAFAMADGTVRIYSGLMDLMNDEELLFVIGHEVGHVVKDHTKKKVMLAYTTSAIKKGLASQNNEVGQIAGSMVGSFVEQLTHAQFSQHEERQADKYGADFLQAEGIQISSAVSALNKLAALAKQHTFLSSHPDPEARAKRLLQGEIDEGEDPDSFLGKVIEKGKTLVIGLLHLLRLLVTWLISLL